MKNFFGAQIVAVAIVVCYLVVRRFYLDYVNFAAWAFLLSVAAAKFVPQSASEKRGMTPRERLIVLCIGIPLFAVAYDGVFLPPSRLDSVGAIGKACVVVWISATAFFLGWSAVRNIIHPAEDVPTVKYVVCAVCATVSIGGFFAWGEERDLIYLFLAVASALMGVISLQRRSLIEFIKSRKGEIK